MSATVSIVAIGELAGRLGVPIREVESAATALRIKPAMLINGTPYFHEKDVERIESEVVWCKVRVLRKRR